MIRTTHVFSLADLKANVPYNYRIKVVDEKDNSNVFVTDNATIHTLQAADTQGPALDDSVTAPITVLETTPNSATIQVLSKENAIAIVQYQSETKDNFDQNSDEKSSSKEYAKIQTIKLSNLIQNKTYYFAVKLQDQSGNAITYDKDAGGNDLIFKTTAGPDISEISCTPGKNDLAIKWKTDEDADSSVEYGVMEDFTSAYKKGTDTLEKNHAIDVDGLFPVTPYYYKVISKNSKGGITQSDAKTCQTLDGVIDTKAPSVSNVQAVFIAKNQALINWSTDIQATSQVQYQKGDQKPSSYEKMGDLNNDMVATHNYLLANLDPDTTYHYEVISRNSIGTEQTSDDYSFHTLSENANENAINAALSGAYVAPKISSASAAVSTTEGTTATITWQTDKQSNSLVSFKSEGSGNYSDQGNAAELVTDHSVVLQNLMPNTTYTYYTKSTDVLGNVGQSDIGTFTTSPTSPIFNVQVVDINYDSATISWETAADTTSQVEYGQNSKFGTQSKEDAKTTKAHAVQITGLSAGTTYNYRLKGKDAAGAPYTSSEYTFSTPAPPQIADFKMDTITENSITARLTTNIETSMFVTLKNLADENDVSTQGDPNMSLTHDVKVSQLKSGATYALEVKVTDTKGNSSTKTIDQYTTAMDTNPPKIDNLRTESALTQNDKVQSIISWKTDEPATTSILYHEAVSDKEIESVVSNSLTYDHVAVVTVFKSGTIYHIHAKSIDAASNVGQSGEYSVLTPKKKQNIIQIIIGNFQSIFNWTGNIGH